ncbi:hypothetical protein PR202_gb25552 [Eleusine coracana subsp. coracana]|uniref:MATH domain-containing protein n=1 Tax=Eleusine coracana subsp. coracana TaxID=191504 RepID=A0AAV5FQA5_ELECO|nr:hypothetical protein QOZ80_8BG0650740 [Eleusine coracana subsp. coracana]GJN36670.1 hypothetical protein PR202_gb25552 [Eleusine coracana subsp. coracana]
MACFLGCFSSSGGTTTEAVKQSKVIDVRGYRSLVNRIKPTEHVSSATFEASGYNWRIRIYPNGSHPDYGPGYVSVFVEFMTPGVAARASAELSLVPWTAGSSSQQPRVFKLGKHTYRHGGSSVWGVPYFVAKSTLETPSYSYLHDDTIRIKCSLTVFVNRPPPSPITVPPTELSADLRKLLDGQGAPPADVLILVGAESFGAHSLVLSSG